MTHWTPARIAEARQRAEGAESVTLPVAQFRELLERVGGTSENEAVKLLQEIVKAYDGHAIEMRSQEIGEPENGIPMHEWHEEWLHYARKIFEVHQ